MKMVARPREEPDEEDQFEIYVHDKQRSIKCRGVKDAQSQLDAIKATEKHHKSKARRQQ